MKQEKKIYFISDVHLGLPDYERSLVREKKLVAWLSEIKESTKELYLMGDIFDFWIDYKRVAPRGYTRFLAKIAEFTDSGIPVHFFTGNHDIWAYDYLPQEIGVTIHRKPVEKEILGKRFYLAHGDGLGNFDKGFKILKSIFTNKVLQWFFARLHPNLALAIGNGWSRKNRYIEEQKNLEFLGEDKEWLVIFSKSLLKTKDLDYLVFGHRHIPVKLEIKKNTYFINLGDWINNFTYGVFDGENFEVKSVDN